MLRLIKKFQQRFNIENAKGLKQEITFMFMLTLPHILTVLILGILFPSKAIGILIVGLLLPDFSYFFHGFTQLGCFSNKNPSLNLRIGINKKISHLLTFVVIVFLLFNGEYVLFLAGGIHLILDLFGF